MFEADNQNPNPPIPNDIIKTIIWGIHAIVKAQKLILDKLMTIEAKMDIMEKETKRNS